MYVFGTPWVTRMEFPGCECRFLGTDFCDYGYEFATVTNTVLSGHGMNFREIPERITRGYGYIFQGLGLINGGTYTSGDAGTDFRVYRGYSGYESGLRENGEHRLIHVWNRSLTGP